MQKQSERMEKTGAGKEEENGSRRPPFRLLAIVHDPERLAYVLEIAAAYPGVRFGAMLRDPEHRAEGVRRLAGWALRRPVPGNLVLITNGVDVEGIEWRHLTGAELRAGIVPAGPFGCSVHSPLEIAAAANIGPRYLLLSPVFPTVSKPGVPALGIDALREHAAAAAVPVIALGGIVTTERAARALAAGAAGVAGISLFEQKNRGILEEVIGEVGEG